MVALTVEGLSVQRGRRTVLDEICVKLGPGELVGIVGPNGAGKSTLVRTMLGLIAPARGSVFLGAVNVRSMPRRAVARSLAYLPQGQTLHWPLEVARVVALGRLPHLGPMSRIGPADRVAIEEAMRRADVAHLAGRSALELSGGERARVMLARALAVEAPGMIVDEPLASLDPGHQIDVMQLLAAEAERGALVVAVLHDLTLAARYCRRLLLIDGGRLVADGLPAQVLDATRLRDTYGITAMIDVEGAVPMVVPLDRSRC